MGQSGDRQVDTHCCIDQPEHLHQQTRQTMARRMAETLDWRDDHAAMPIASIHS
jgi:hypothetical protein